MKILILGAAENRGRFPYYHGFDALEEIELIEVKQGPYADDADKTRFGWIAATQVVLK